MTFWDMQVYLQPVAEALELYKTCGCAWIVELEADRYLLAMARDVDTFVQKATIALSAIEAEQEDPEVTNWRSRMSQHDQNFLDIKGQYEKFKGLVDRIRGADAASSRD